MGILTLIDMLTQLFILVCSLFLVVFCANYLVEGSSLIAKKAGVNEFMIGLFIVGMGTSLPELVVSMVGAFEGNSDVAIGNIIGSNIFNTGMILGLSAVIAPIAVSEVNSRRDIPFMLMATALFLLMGLGSGGINRIEGVTLVLFFAMYVYYLIKFDKKEIDSYYEIPSGLMSQSLSGAIIIVVGSIIGLIIGGKLFVDSAIKLGHLWNISDKVIAITVLAFGTSLPELATCIVAIVKKHSQMALGDIIGSNIFNILLIIGLSSIVHPVGFQNINIVDVIAFAACMFIVFISQHTTHKGVITRFDGVAMLMTFVIYIILLFNL